MVSSVSNHRIEPPDVDRFTFHLNLTPRVPEASRFDEIELLDEAELAEAAGGSIAALNVDA